MRWRVGRRSARPLSCTPTSSRPPCRRRIWSSAPSTNGCVYTGARGVQSPHFRLHQASSITSGQLANPLVCNERCLFKTGAAARCEDHPRHSPHRSCAPQVPSAGSDIQNVVLFMLGPCREPDLIDGPMLYRIPELSTDGPIWRAGAGDGRVGYPSVRGGRDAYSRMHRTDFGGRCGVVDVLMHCSVVNDNTCRLRTRCLAALWVRTTTTAAGEAWPEVRLQFVYCWLPSALHGAAGLHHLQHHTL